MRRFATISTLGLGLKTLSEPESHYSDNLNFWESFRFTVDFGLGRIISWGNDGFGNLSIDLVVS